MTAPDPAANPAPVSAPPQTPKRKLIDSGFVILCTFSLAAAVAVAATSGWWRVVEIALEGLAFIALLSPKILIGVFIASTVPLLLPRDRVAVWIGTDSGPRGLAIAALAGAAIPGGPAVIFLLGAGFVTAGADIGAIIAFVSGWSLLNLNRTLIWELSFLPSDLVLLRCVLCLPIPIALGLLARLLFCRGRS